MTPTRIPDPDGTAGPDADAEGGKPQRGIQSLDSTGQLLGALVAAGRPLTLRDLALAAGMPAAKAFPHLVSLQKTGLLARDAAGNYLCGPLGLELGLVALQRLSPTREAEPEVIELAGTTGLSVAMAVLGPMGPTVVRLEESARPQHVSLRVGTVLSLVHTAIGRTVAAHLPGNVLAGLLQTDYLRMAGAAVGQVLGEDGNLTTDYAARLAQVREAQIDNALSHPVPGIDTLAVPVFDHTGSLALVIAVMGSSGSFDSGTEGAPAALVRQAARRLSWRFGALRGAAG
ncbi:IclR family transcriptional regulator [Cupriavidus oxalaticus]|uniref:IclR family transcriptional regulator n=1 Tax=Cupriavidus oxalaticus TaxID=96344 RepID=A0A375GQZ9_9BURK|nr:IclR family transcriptional regulator [Cupriavidus oxalaticus]QRQ85377.1 IclR family transcriptional regulator [Cupriavidus oxalaticus]QRQ90535.1 IclR family transcriptional regulator [Cupriavidus oxalaticus]WQD85055.1 IclR family transcriptional regulator [Cupriavidus oxalaticus]SPC24167.1 putative TRANSCRIPTION REGULATOR PROTEIN, iclR domain [Cupriavidus oxalaticus]